MAVLQRCVRYQDLLPRLEEYQRGAAAEISEMTLEAQQLGPCE